MASEAAKPRDSVASQAWGAQAARTAWVGEAIPVGPPDDTTIIDCDRCTMRGIGCGDCVVTVLLGGPPFGVQLDVVELRALNVLADAGLIPPLRMDSWVQPADSS